MNNFEVRNNNKQKLNLQTTNMTFILQALNSTFKSKSPRAIASLQGIARHLSSTSRTMLSFKDVATKRAGSTEELWKVFDSLPPVAVSDLVGYKWKGYEVDNGHPWVGKLESNNWFGKQYHDEDNGDALLIYANEQKDGETFAADGLKTFKAFNSDTERVLFKDRAKYEANGSICRLKTILHRGVNTASMFYDQLPVNDSFRKVDDNTVFGVMDNKVLPDPPYFFVLEKFSKL